jgi:hypothetical protein
MSELDDLLGEQEPHATFHDACSAAESARFEWA